MGFPGAGFAMGYDDSGMAAPTENEIWDQSFKFVRKSVFCIEHRCYRRIDDPQHFEYPYSQQEIPHQTAPRAAQSSKYHDNSIFTMEDDIAKVRRHVFQNGRAKARQILKASQ